MADLVLDRFLPYQLSVTSNLVSDTIARAYRALFGLSIAEWRVLAVVAEGEALTQGAIGQRTRLDKMTVSRAAVALAGRKLVRRVVPHADRRSRALTLTEAGRALYDAVVPRALELERALFEGFAPDERALLTAMLQRIDRTALALADEEPVARPPAG